MFVGTNCGVAISTDSGATWTFVDPTPATPASDVWDVVVHDGGIIDVCGDDGHYRSTNGGASWIGGTGGLPTGFCSIAVSPDESYVLFVTVGLTSPDVFESDDAGASWTMLINPEAGPQGRIPFVRTNQRSNTAAGDNIFDLWYGDIPIFTSRPCDLDMRTSRGERLPGFFQVTGMDAARERIRRLSDEDLERQLAEIRSRL